MTDCELLQIDKKAMMLALHREHAFSDLFVAYLLARNIRYEEDLVASEKEIGSDSALACSLRQGRRARDCYPKISPETLAEMVGTTRSRVSFFMNRFRKLGFVDYGGSGMQVHSVAELGCRCYSLSRRSRVRAGTRSTICSLIRSAKELDALKSSQLSRKTAWYSSLDLQRIIVLGMSGSDFKLTESTRAVFTCERGTVQFYFVVADKDVGKRFFYTLEEAATLGERIFKIGSWEEFPVSGICTSELRSFGQRLREYGINGR